MTADNAFLEFTNKNKDALMFIFTADQDYVAARCCILNALFAGFALASQAIEKSLKAFICIESGKKMKTNHNPYELKEILKKYKDYDLDKYDRLLKKLFDHYQMRYHDNFAKYGTNGASGEELKEIDKLWIDLKEKLPIPEENKFRTMFFVDLFEHNPYWNNEFWLKQNNLALAHKLDLWEKKYKRIMPQSHLIKTPNI